MESNKDEALKCLSIAQKHRNAANFPSARRFCQKSLALFATPEATRLLQAIDREEQSAGGSGASAGEASAASNGGASTSGAETHPSAPGTRHRHHQPETNGKATANGSASANEKKREYTPEQAAVVKRIRACKVTEYYEIMSLKRDCEEADVKKAYRKLALSLHPDKNGAPGADEAFKLVSKAFQVLSDPQKRAAYDQHGSDPESRFGGMSSSSSRGAAGFGPSPFGGGFDGELSPEDLFNMFFGGGPMGGTSFGGGPVFTATFGPGGFRTTRMGGRGTVPQGGGNNNGQPRSLLIQLLPLFILFGFSLLNTLPSLFSTPSTPDPRFSFQPNSRFNVERHTTGMGVKYHVNAAEFSGHPIAAELARAGSGAKTAGSSGSGSGSGSEPSAGADTARSGSGGKKAAGGETGPVLRKFEETVERVYTQELLGLCQRGLDSKERRKDEEVGVFGIGTDWAKVKRIEEEKVESCDELRRLGLIAR